MKKAKIIRCSNPDTECIYKDLIGEEMEILTEAKNEYGLKMSKLGFIYVLKKDCLVREYDIYQELTDTLEKIEKEIVVLKKKIKELNR